MSAPHEKSPTVVERRRGATWVLADDSDAALYVEWEAPLKPSGLPLVLVHGGGGQGTDWTITHDGGPSWRDELVRAGHPVYVIDRPGHGRASHRPASPGVGTPPGPEVMAMIFAPSGQLEHHQWSGSRDPGGIELRRLAAGQAPLPADPARAQATDAALLATLLRDIGPSVLITHSAGAPVGWLAAQTAPEIVRAIVAVEPMGPPFIEMPGFGALTWGVTSAPLATEPEVVDPAELRSSTDIRFPGLDSLPVLVVTGSASAAAPGGAAIAAFLAEHGVAARHLALADVGVVGNGHGLMSERNAPQTANVVADWIQGAVQA